MNTLRRFALCLAASAPLAAYAQDYPSKPIRVVVPFVAGAGGDIGARLVAAPMAEAMGQPMLVDNRAGAGESIGVEIVAKSAPDGYTILIGSSNGLVQRPLLSTKTSYDPVRDLTAITQIGKSTAVIVANPSFPASTLGELIAYMKANPGKVAYGTSGIGTAHHLAAEQIKMLTGAQMLHVPYKSGIQPLNDVMGGLIPVSSVILGTLVPQLKSGKVKPIAVLADVRHPRLPDTPVVAETLPAFRVPPSYFAMMGPANLPQPVLRRLNAEAVKAIRQPNLWEKLDAMGFGPVASTPEEFANTLREGIELSARIIKAAGIEAVSD